jgi:CheY-like chemotaxis protein
MSHLLLVDDNSSVLVTLSIALRRHGHTVTTALNAAQALALLRRERYDFLISDVRMPGMSGLELAAHARLLPHPPAIILTSAYASIEVREGLVTAFFRKPVDTEKLHQLLLDAPARALPAPLHAGDAAKGQEKNGASGNHAPPPIKPFKPV